MPILHDHKLHLCTRVLVSGWYAYIQAHPRCATALPFELNIKQATSTHGWHELGAIFIKEVLSE